jgi:glyoxylase-like metal-dependent hydrolase (beta-lactamase superfamily II)
MEHYEVKQINPWLYSIKELDVFCYLIIGDDEALLFDAVYGLHSLSDVVGKLTDKPVTVVLGHGHIDHVNAAWQFENVFLHDADSDIYKKHTSEEYRRIILNRATEDSGSAPNGIDADEFAKFHKKDIRPLSVGQIFKLGNLTVEIIGMAGHTPGSIGLLVHEHSVLLTSDSACPHVWVFLDESLSLSDYIKMLERVYKLPFDTFFVGHSDEEMDKSVFMRFITTAKNADPAKSEPYQPFEGSRNAMSGLIYKEGDVEIVFNPDKM